MITIKDSPQQKAICRKKLEKKIEEEIKHFFEKEGKKTRKKLSRVKSLQYVYDKYGARSLEFYVYCYPFIKYILNRFVIGEVEEDLINECYIKVSKALEKCFNPEKGNIATYIFTVVRNRIKSYYQKENKRKSNEIILENSIFSMKKGQFFEGEISGIENFDNDEASDFEEAFLEKNKFFNFEICLNSMPLIKINDDNLEIIKKEIFQKEKNNHLLYKVALWEHLSGVSSFENTN